MLAVKHSRLGIVVNDASRTRNELIRPPIMRRNDDIQPRLHDQLASSLVEHHSIAARNALDERVREVRGQREKRRKAECDTRVTDQLSATTIKGRNIGRLCLQPLNSDLQLLAIPDIVLIAPCKIVCLDIGATGQRQKIGYEAFLRTSYDTQTVAAPTITVFLKNSRSTILGTVIRNY